ncbi:MAG TPA: hypothetical protein VIY86_03195 [Pirellulaceae bacterium]
MYLTYYDDPSSTIPFVSAAVTAKRSNQLRVVVTSLVMTHIHFNHFPSKSLENHELTKREVGRRPEQVRAVPAKHYRADEKPGLRPSAPGFRLT